MMYITILIVATLNMLTNHTMLTSKKSNSYCVIAFIINSIVVIVFSFIFRGLITDPTIYKYVFYLTAFLYFGYIHLVFSDSLQIKIFSMLSIWVFSTMITSISNITFNIIGDQTMTLYIVNSIRIILQLLLLGVSYKWYGDYFKKILGWISSSRRVRFTWSAMKPTWPCVLANGRQRITSRAKSASSALAPTDRPST